MPRIAPGAGIFLTAEYDRIRAGFSALGRQGLPAERVAEIAIDENDQIITITITPA